MNLTKQPQVKQNLLGYVNVNSGACLIADLSYASLCTDYFDADSQIVVPTNLELGHIRAGVWAETDLIDDGEFPVYAEYEADLLLRISIEIHLFITEEQKFTSKMEESRLLDTTTQLIKKLLGYVAVNGGCCLITDMENVQLCLDHFNTVDSQITVPIDCDQFDSFRAGVLAETQIDDREFPVYGEYEGDLLKRITIEIADSTQG